MISERANRIIKIFKNKYTITIVFLMTWLMFFDRYDFVTQYKTVKELKQLEEEKLYYVNEIAKNEQDLKQLKENPIYLERFAREKYLMKQPNEDVFIILDNRTNTIK
ncbi:MAG TPA: septum formation initiator family protein [Bacteroidia bacterium]|nr:septum formation initiator family protein [Bacteroidia bacterium]